MTKDGLMQLLLIRNDLVADMTTLDQVVNALWVLMDLPQTGELIRLGGEFGEKYSVEKGQIKTSVTFTDGDENLLKTNRLVGCPVAVFGVQVVKADPEDGDEHPGQMKIDDVVAQADTDLGPETTEQDPAA